MAGAARGSVEDANRTARDLPCAHYPHCVGCTFIGKPYGEQLRLKHARVVEAMREYASLGGVEVAEVVGSPRAFGYRNQAKLVVRRARPSLQLGIYKPGTHDVVDIRNCAVHHPLIASVLRRAAPVLDQLDIPIYDEGTHQGVLRYFVVRISNWAKRAQIILVTNGSHLPKKAALVRALEAIPGVVSIVQNINESPGNVILGDEFVALTREAALVERIADLKLKTHAGAFLQANIQVARKLYLYASAQAQLSSDDVAVDLYCGAGALAFFLAGYGGNVFGIEASRVAIADAKGNVRLNGFHNVRFDCAEAAAGLATLAQRLPRIDVVTLNPPRKGADAATRDAIAGAQPRRIVYVSCDPGTLARDLDWFAAHGYGTLRLQPFDMLPQTEHVECVATLERR